MAEELIKRVDRALVGLLTKGECRSLQYHAEKWMGWIAAAVPTFLGAQFYLFGMLIDAGVFSLYPTVLCIFLTAGLDAILIPLTLRWRNRLVYHRIMARIKQLDIRPHYCLNCEYDLKGSVADHCPECGTALAPVEVDDIEVV